MRLTERELRKLIREEILREGLLDTVKGALGMQDQKKPGIFTQQGDKQKLAKLLSNMLKAADDRDTWQSIVTSWNRKFIEPQKVDRVTYSDYTVAEAIDTPAKEQLAQFIKNRLESSGKSSPTEADKQICSEAIEAATREIPKNKKR